MLKSGGTYLHLWGSFQRGLMCSTVLWEWSLDVFGTCPCPGEPDGKSEESHVHVAASPFFLSACIAALASAAIWLQLLIAFQQGFNSSASPGKRLGFQYWIQTAGASPFLHHGISCSLSGSLSLQHVDCHCWVTEPLSYKSIHSVPYYETYSFSIGPFSLQESDYKSLDKNSYHLTPSLKYTWTSLWHHRLETELLICGSLEDNYFPHYNKGWGHVLWLCNESTYSYMQKRWSQGRVGYWEGVCWHSHWADRIKTWHNFTK